MRARLPELTPNTSLYHQLLIKAYGRAGAKEQLFKVQMSNYFFDQRTIQAIRKYKRKDHAVVTVQSKQGRLLTWNSRKVV